MKRSVGLWQLMGFAVTSFAGTLLHFLYEWLGKSPWIAPLSGVNESTWEHMKLLFWPMLFFAVVQSFFFRDCKAFWCIKLRGITLGLALIPVLFYTYNGVIGNPPTGSTSQSFSSRLLPPISMKRGFFAAKRQDAVTPVLLGRCFASSPFCSSYSPLRRLGWGFLQIR